MESIKNLQIYAPGKYWVANADALTEINVKKVRITTAGAQYFTGGGSWLIERDEEHQLDFYRHKEDFNHGDKAKRKAVINFGGKVVGCKWYDPDFCYVHPKEMGDGLFVSAYFFQNNDAKSAALLVDEITINANCVAEIKLVADYSELYTTREIALAMNDVAVKDMDGNITIRHSPYKKLALSEEQRAAVDALVYAWNKLEELNVGKIVHLEGEEILFYSKNEGRVSNNENTTEDTPEIVPGFLETQEFPGIYGWHCLCDDTWNYQPKK